MLGLSKGRTQNQPEGHKLSPGYSWFVHFGCEEPQTHGITEAGKALWDHSALPRPPLPHVPECKSEIPPGMGTPPLCQAGKPPPLTNSPQYPTLNGTFTCLHPLQPTGRAFRTPHSQQLPEMAEADEELGGEAGSAQLGWNKAQLGSPGSRAVTSKMWTHI